MKALIIDVESVGEPFDSLDETTKHVMLNPLHKKYKNPEEYAAAFEDLKLEMGLSALTGATVTVGMYDAETLQGWCYFDTAGRATTPFEENGIQFIPASEKQMLEAFWAKVPEYNAIVTFNGWGFDIPFLNHRAAFHHVKPTRNLMTNRFLSSQRGPIKHIDLQDVLSYNGAIRRKGSLHLWCRAFGIASPKVLGEAGDDVARMYKEGQFETIARYNARDLIATKQLYDYWSTYLKLV